MRDMATPVTLSPAAHAVLAGAFSRPTGMLTFDFEKSCPSATAQEGLDELVAGGVIETLPGAKGGVSYRLTESGQAMDRTPPGDTPAEKMDYLRTHARFPLYAPAPSTELNP